MSLPTMFMESWFINGEENAGGGNVYIVLEEGEDTALLGEFGFAEEMTYLTYSKDGDCIFEAATDKHEDIDKPPFLRVFEVDKEALKKELKTETYISGEDVREAWENWSEGDILRFTIDGDDRKFEHTYELLREYDRQSYLREKTA